jgi:hypothetical protein
VETAAAAKREQEEEEAAQASRVRAALAERAASTRSLKASSLKGPGSSKAPSRQPSILKFAASAEVPALALAKVRGIYALSRCCFLASVADKYTASEVPALALGRVCS